MSTPDFSYSNSQSKNMPEGHKESDLSPIQPSEGIQESELSWEDRAERAVFQLQGAQEIERIWNESEQGAVERAAERNAQVPESARYRRIDEMESFLVRLESDKTNQGTSLLAVLDKSAIQWLEDFRASILGRQIFAELHQSAMSRLQGIIERAKYFVDFRRGGWERLAEEEIHRLELGRTAPPSVDRPIGAIVKQRGRKFEDLFVHAKKIPFIYGELLRRFGKRFEELNPDAAQRIKKWDEPQQKNKQ
jgi:hypothetical protein